jgi:hypothetical protein
MTTRERWIVYPLLLLSLGIALRDKVVPPMHTTTFAVTAHKIEADTIRCNTLQAGQAEFQTMAADKVSWKETSIDAGMLRLGLRVSDEEPRPAKKDSPE